MLPQNRLGDYFKPPPPWQRVIENASNVKFELQAYRDDKNRPRVGCEYTIVGFLDVADDAPTAELLRGLVQALAQRKGSADQ